MKNYDAHWVPIKTPDEKKAMRADKKEHLSWLADHGLGEPPWWAPKSESQYTGILLAALLDPDAAPTVFQALLAGSSSPTEISLQSVAWALWPSSGIDIISLVNGAQKDVMLVVEHKRFASPSHGRSGAWQTDQEYEKISRGEPPSGVHPKMNQLPSSDEVYYVVLDGYGLPMERIFEGGSSNDKWTVTSYRQFGNVLRAAYDHRVPGLVPLLVALYAGL